MLEWKEQGQGEMTAQGLPAYALANKTVAVPFLVPKTALPLIHTACVPVIR